MNDLARERLREAALKGVPQIKGMYRDPFGGRCALGVLDQEGRLSTTSWQALTEFQVRLGLSDELRGCPECGKGPYTEPGLILHYNDDHDMDFLAIANKL